VAVAAATEQYLSWALAFFGGDHADGMLESHQAI
jgi:hypothetical protein